MLMILNVVVMVMEVLLVVVTLPVCMRVVRDGASICEQHLPACPAHRLPPRYMFCC